MSSVAPTLTCECCLKSAQEEYHWPKQCGFPSCRKLLCPACFAYCPICSRPSRSGCWACIAVHMKAEIEEKMQEYGKMLKEVECRVARHH